MGRIFVGISGWRYTPWRGVFYPETLAQHRELEYASRELPTIEINGSFYSLQRPQNYAAWYRDTPPGFVFAVKGGRFITHMKRLKDIEKPLANFFAQGVLELKEKTGPFLWQFPPMMRYEPERFERFFELLPRDMEQALSLARRRDARMLGRARLAIGPNRSLRHAVEVRHESFLCEGFVQQLRRHRVALVVADTAGRWPYCEDVTADFVYVRLHGDKQLYASGYTDAALERWAQRIRAWSEGTQPPPGRCISARPPPRRRARDVYCYFDNDVKVRAPYDARRLMQKLGLAAPTVRPRRPVLRKPSELPRLRWPGRPRVAAR